jgi:aminoglycoside 6'-N-acetyltransferase I
VSASLIDGDLLSYDIRPLADSHVTAAADLASASSGRPAIELAQAYLKTLEQPDDGFLVGAFRNDDMLIGFARTLRLSAEDLRSDRPVPEGWYLLGVNVREEFKRRGIGHALTCARLDHLRNLTDHIYYTVRFDNAASVRLHSRFGFERIDGGYTMPPSVTNLDLYRLRF